MQDLIYSDESQLSPPEIRTRLSSDILWLGVTGFMGAAIIGILCGPVLAQLSPGILAGATSVRPSVRAAPGTGPSSVGTTLASVYRADRIAAPVAPLTTVNEGGERASNVASIPPIVPPSEPNGTNLSPLDPITDRPPAQPLADRDKLTPVLRAPQQNHSAAAPSQSHQLGPPRVRQPHRQVQPAGRPQKSELMPW